MICRACRERRHGECPELARQDREDLTGTELAGSPWCDCRHSDGAANRTA